MRRSCSVSRSRPAARCDHPVTPPGPLDHTGNTTGRRSPHEPPGWPRYRRRRNPTPAHEPHVTARRRGRHWTHYVHRVARWPSEDSLRLPTIPLHTEHGIAPLPVTIGTTPETTRSLCSLTNFFAGLIAVRRSPASRSGFAGRLRSTWRRARGWAWSPGHTSATCSTGSARIWRGGSRDCCLTVGRSCARPATPERTDRT